MFQKSILNGGSFYNVYVRGTLGEIFTQNRSIYVNTKNVGLAIAPYFPHFLCPKSVYWLPNRRTKITLGTSHSLCNCLSVAGSKPQAKHNPKKLHLKYSNVSGSVSVKWLMTANLHDCETSNNRVMSEHKSNYFIYMNMEMW